MQNNENTERAESAKGVQFPAELSLRDYFAAKAMAAMLVGHKWNTLELAEHAYKCADAMLAKRAKGTP